MFRTQLMVSHRSGLLSQRWFCLSQFTCRSYFALNSQVNTRRCMFAVWYLQEVSLRASPLAGSYQSLNTLSQLYLYRGMVNIHRLLSSKNTLFVSLKPYTLIGQTSVEKTPSSWINTKSTTMSYSSLFLFRYPCLDIWSFLVFSRHTTKLLGHSSSFPCNVCVRSLWI